MIQDVAPIFSAVAMPLAASARVPVVPAPARVIVSVVMAMLRTLISFTNVRVVPIGKAMLPFAGIVNVRGLLSAVGCSKCLFASDAMIG